ncbi:MAG: sugar phosphate isomerase/epimerase [Balneolales bacterium]
MAEKTTTRKNFLKLSALSAGGLAFGGANSAMSKSNSMKAISQSSVSNEILKFGIASYSLRHFDRPEAIKMIKDIGSKYVSVKSFHLPEEYSSEELMAARKEFEEAGLTIVSGGVIYLREDNDDYMRQRFEYARTCGMPIMVIGPTPENLPRVEKFVKEFDIKVAIHNHGPDSTFPSPLDAMELIKNMDPRVGICNDLGHTVRTGEDVIESIEKTKDRLFEIHLKDLKDLSDKDTQCIVGEGNVPVAAIFNKLIQINFQGIVGLEYEIEKENPLPGMKQSYAYMRGVADGLKNTMNA